MSNPKIFEYALSLPFRVDDFGGIASTTSQSKIWADRVRSAVGTTVSERVMRPEFGTEIPENLFDDPDVLGGTIESEVELVFDRDLPNLELDEVTVLVDESMGIVTANVSYFLPNKEQAAVTIGIATISPSTPIQEELL
jgi:phage baseplate assembly protein W